MPKRHEFEGKVYEFDDDFTDDEVRSILEKESAAPKQEKGMLEKAWDWEKEQVQGAWDAGKKLATNVAQGKVFTDENAGLLGDVSAKSGAALLPLAPAAIAAGVATVGAVPTAVAAGLGMAGGMVGGWGARKAAEVAGAGEGVQKLAGEVGAWAGGLGAGSRFNKLASLKSAKKVPPSGQPAAKGFDADDFVRANQEKLAEQAESLSQLGKAKRADVEGMDRFMSNVVNADYAMLQNLKRQAAKGGADMKDFDELSKVIENATAVARRPDAPQIAAVERHNFEPLLRDAAKGKTTSAHPRIKLLSAYVDAKRQNTLVREGKITPDKLPPSNLGGDRVQENAKFLAQYADEFEPVARSLHKLGMDELAVGVESGLVSPQEARLLAKTDFYVPFTPAKSQIEKSAEALLNPFQSSRVVGKGQQDFANRLAKDLSRESLDPVQAALDRYQTVQRMASRNKALKAVAEKATVLDEYGQVVGNTNSMFKEILVVPGARDGKAMKRLPEKLMEVQGAVPVWINGKEHQVIGDPALIKSFENWGAVATETAGPIANFALGLARAANRGMKMTTTGFAAPNRKLLNVAYNYLQVYQQLPLSVSGRAILDSFSLSGNALLHTIGQGHRTSKAFKALRKEGLEKAAFGTSSEIVRGVGEKNVGYVMAKGDPLTELPRYAIFDPLKEAGKAVKGKPYDPQVVKQFGVVLDDIVRKVEDVTTFDEVGLRMAVYKNSEKWHLSKGMPAEKAKEMAAYDARNIITDFSKRGNWAKHYDLVGQPFAQAAMTGIVTNLQYAQRDPMGFALRTSMPWLAHVAMTNINYADPERRKIVEDIQDDAQIRNIVLIPDPAKVKKNEQGRYVEGIYLIPAPESSVSRGLNMFNVLAAKTNTSEQNMANTLSLMWTGLKHAVPYELNPAMAAAAIPVAGALGELALNRNTFSGAPIFSERAARTVDQELPSGVKMLMDAGGVGNKGRIGARYLLEKSFPVMRSYNRISSQQGDLSPASRFARMLMEPVTSVAGNRSKREKREETFDERLERTKRLPVK